MGEDAGIAFMLGWLPMMTVLTRKVRRVYWLGAVLSLSSPERRGWFTSLVLKESGGVVVAAHRGVSGW